MCLILTPLFVLDPVYNSTSIFCENTTTITAGNFWSAFIFVCTERTIWRYLSAGWTNRLYVYISLCSQAVLILTFYAVWVLHDYDAMYNNRPDLHFTYVKIRTTMTAFCLHSSSLNWFEWYVIRPGRVDCEFAHAHLHAWHMLNYPYVAKILQWWCSFGRRFIFVKLMGWYDMALSLALHWTNRM